MISKSHDYVSEMNYQSRVHTRGLMVQSEPDMSLVASSRDCEILENQFRYTIMELIDEKKLALTGSNLVNLADLHLYAISEWLAER